MQAAQPPQLCVAAQSRLFLSKGKFPGTNGKTPEHSGQSSFFSHTEWGFLTERKPCQKNPNFLEHALKNEKKIRIYYGKSGRQAALIIHKVRVLQALATHNNIFLGHFAQNPGNPDTHFKKNNLGHFPEIRRVRSPENTLRTTNSENPRNGAANRQAIWKRQHEVQMYFMQTSMAVGEPFK